MVEARGEKKGRGLVWREKGRDFVFISVWGAGRGGGRKRTGIKTHTTFFLPLSARPPWAGLRGQREVPRGRLFCPFCVCVSCFLRPWLPSLAPHFVQLRLWKEKGDRQ